MKKSIIVGVLALSLTSCKSEKHSMEQLRDAAGYVHVTSPKEACLVYPKTGEELKERSQRAIQKIKEVVDCIIAVPVDQQNRQTMIYQFDRLDTATFDLGIFEFVEHVYPDEVMRQTAAEESTKIRDFYTDTVSMNIDLYHAFKKYYEGNAVTEELADFERYFLDELIKDFKRSGLDLLEEQRKKVAELTKKINQIGQAFSRNISEDITAIALTEDALPGVAQEFIQALEKDVEGNFLLRTDYPTYDMIMNYCSQQETRKQFFKAFKNKAYPKNKEVLDQLITTRDQLAHELGFASYADLDLNDQMIQSTERAWSFEKDMQQRTIEKAQQEFERLTETLPEGVILSGDGKMYPWDSGYVSTYFKKRHYDIDERVIAEYFPMDKALEGLMNIYQTFFSITIKKVPVTHVWHADVELLEVADVQTHKIYGYVFLDMFPRTKKYGHAAQFSGVTAYQASDGSYYPGVVALVCNFTKPTATKPSLLKYNEVNVFFHEFGHALHSILGGTRLALQAGTSVKRDFVELPSQMLENWLENASILKNLSCHYQTGEQMPDELINKKLELLKFGLAMQTSGQLMFGMTALAYYGKGDHKDTDALWKQYAQELMPYVVYDEDTHSQCSFGHLMGYGAKYYGYLWSKVLGQDVFATIEQEGLLNQKVGKRYCACILSKGGSKDPNQLLVDFLGRQPNADAFFKKMGL